MNIKLIAKRDDDCVRMTPNGGMACCFEFSEDQSCEKSIVFCELIGKLNSKSSFYNPSILKILKKLGFSVEISVLDRDVFQFIAYMNEKNIPYTSFSREHYSTVSI